MERLRSIKITVEIDTNKTTHLKTFDKMEDAKGYHDDIISGITNP